jgi:hypothetical protein
MRSKLARMRLDSVSKKQRMNEILKMFTRGSSKLLYRRCRCGHGESGEGGGSSGSSCPRFTPSQGTPPCHLAESEAPASDNGTPRNRQHQSIQSKQACRSGGCPLSHPPLLYPPRCPHRVAVGAPRGEPSRINRQTDCPRREPRWPQVKKTITGNHPRA